MFLHCVAKNVAEVKKPWHEFLQAGNSLFLFRLSVAVITFVGMAIFCGLIGFMVVMSRNSAGMSIATNNATIAITTRSSIRVKPSRLAIAVFLVLPPCMMRSGRRMFRS